MLRGIKPKEIQDFKQESDRSMLMRSLDQELGVAMLGDLVRCQRLYPFLDNTIGNLIRACGPEHNLYHAIKLGNQSTFEVMNLILLVEKEYQDDERNHIFYWIGQHLLANFPLTSTTLLMNVTDRMSGPMRDRLLFHGAQSAVRRGEYEIGIQLMRDVRDEEINADWCKFKSPAVARYTWEGEWIERDCLYYSCLVAIETLNKNMYGRQLFLDTLRDKVNTIFNNRFNYICSGIESRKRWRELGDTRTKLKRISLIFKRLRKRNLAFFNACFKVIEDGYIYPFLQRNS